MSDLWPDIEPDSESSVDRSSDKRRKYQEDLDDQEKEEVVSSTLSNPRSIRKGDQRELRNLKCEIKISKDNIFSSSTYLQDKQRPNGTWYRWIYNSKIFLSLGITGCTSADGTSYTTRNALRNVQRNVDFVRIL